MKVKIPSPLTGEGWDGGEIEEVGTVNSIPVPL